MPVIRALVGHSRRLAIASAIAGCLAMASSAEAQSGHGRSLAEKLRHGPGVLNHPTGVVPSAEVSLPAGWPLDADGSIGCLTCHEVVPPLEGATDLHLRGFGGAQVTPGEFCVGCHNGNDQRTASAMHWLAVGVAHVGPDSVGSVSSSGMLDSESRRCLECHDGVSASEHANAPSDRRMGFAGDPRRAHPVGVPYRGVGRRKASAPLRAENLLPNAVRLPQGLVSCVSCHNLYAQEPHLLAVPIEGSRLCFSCHDMD